MISNSSNNSSKRSGSTNYELKSVPKGKKFEYLILRGNIEIQLKNWKNWRKEQEKSMWTQID